MLQLRRSRLRQSNPSILTAAGLCPNFILTHPPAATRGDGGVTMSQPNWASWITGFEALLGGDPQKYGGDEATWLLNFSPP